jgi:hypothetical protein
MRTALAFVLLLACSASSNAPPGADAGDSAPPDAAPADAACDFTRQRLIPGRGCVSSTPQDCDGMACARGLICNGESGPDGGTIFLCIMDPGG